MATVAVGIIIVVGVLIWRVQWFRRKWKDRDVF